MRAGPLLLLLPALCLALGLAGSVGRPVYDPAGPITATPIPLDQDAPGPIRVGALRFAGGWVLRSPNADFGGLSTMVADDDGRFVAIGDKGTAFRFRMGPDGTIGRSSIRDLPGTGPRKAMSDTESMTVDPDTGTIWVGYEARNILRRFDPALTRITGEVAPKGMADWPAPTGAESMVRMADGRFVVIAENVEDADRIKPALLFPGDPVRTAARAIRFGYRPPAPGFWPTDIRQLPDGRLLVLHRKLSVTDGFSAALAVFDPRDIRPGGIVAGREIARFHQPLAIDNMEALAITREAGGTMIWIASDDNFLWLQRTLLLKFRLEG